MVDHVLHGPPDVPILLRRSGRARRISLRISQLDGRVTLTLPSGVHEAEGTSGGDGGRVDHGARASGSYRGPFEGAF